MAAVGVRNSAVNPPAARLGTPGSDPMQYDQLEIRSRRLDDDRVEIWIQSSPTGTKGKPCEVRAPRSEWDALSVEWDISWSEAAILGRRLASILLPTPVYAGLQEAFRALEGNRGPTR